MRQLISCSKKKNKTGFLLPFLLNIFLVVSFLFISAIEPVYGQDQAKYTILMIADGCGAKHREAVNNYLGITPTYQSDPAWVHHWISTYPFGWGYNTAQAWTNFSYVLQGNPPASADAATAMYSGVKTQSSRIMVSADGTNRLFSIGEKAKIQGKAVGAVTTTPITDATPGAFCAHNDNRSNTYAIADECLFQNPNVTGDIQLIQNMAVLMG